MNNAAYTTELADERSALTRGAAGQCLAVLICKRPEAIPFAFTVFPELPQLAAADTERRQRGRRPEAPARAVLRGRAERSLEI